jgi:hypothetical protein
MKFAMSQNNFRILGTITTFALLTMANGCAHALMRGSVAMKSNDNEAHVCLGDNEVKAGDKVVLFKNVCAAARGGGKSGPNGTCEKVKLGEGTVERTLNEHYSVVKVNPGVPFEEGTVVEKE